MAFQPQTMSSFALMKKPDSNKQPQRRLLYDLQHGNFQHIKYPTFSNTKTGSRVVVRHKTHKYINEIAADEMMFLCSLGSWQL
jgi:hypothetical protein